MTEAEIIEAVAKAIHDTLPGSTFVWRAAPSNVQTMCTQAARAAIDAYEKAKAGDARGEANSNLSPAQREDET